MRKTFVSKEVFAGRQVKYMDGKRITPEQGKVYKNRGGGEFLCIRGFDGDAIMQNTISGWTFQANGIIQYEDGSVEWDYSTRGHFGCLS